MKNFLYYWLSSCWGSFCGLLWALSYYGIVRLALFSSILLAQGEIISINAEQQQNNRLVSLEEKVDGLQVIRNVEYGVLVGVFAFGGWFLRKTAKHTEEIAIMSTKQGHYESTLGKIEAKVDKVLENNKTLSDIKFSVDRLLEK